MGGQETGRKPQPLAASLRLDWTGLPTSDLCLLFPVPQTRSEDAAAMNPLSPVPCPLSSYNAAMFPLFLGLTISNLLLLCTVFVLGLFVVDHQSEVTDAYDWHIPLGIAAGLMVALTHVAIYMYHMATARWLEAATDKTGVPQARWARPALARKRRIFFLMMAAIGSAMIAMFAGALADPLMNPLWPGEVHMAAGILALSVNIAVAFSEARHIQAQGRLMDDALRMINEGAGAGAAAAAGDFVAAASSLRVCGTGDEIVKTKSEI